MNLLQRRSFLAGSAVAAMAAVLPRCQAAPSMASPYSEKIMTEARTEVRRRIFDRHLSAWMKRNHGMPRLASQEPTERTEEYFKSHMANFCVYRDFVRVVDEATKSGEIVCPAEAPSATPRGNLPLIEWGAVELAKSRAWFECRHRTVVWKGRQEEAHKEWVAMFNAHCRIDQAVYDEIDKAIERGEV